MPARWSYVGVEATTGRVLESLPLTGVKMSLVLSGHGSLTGTLNLQAQRPDRWAALTDAVDCGRRAVYALADGRPMWGGPVWTDPDQGGDVLTVGCTEWGGYFAKRVIRNTLTYAQVDQLAIARGLLTDAQGVPGGNVGVALGVETSGVLRDRTYAAGNLQVVAEQLANLANVDGGFDFAWPVEFNGGGFLRGRLLLGYPTLGTTTAQYVVHAPKGRARATALARSAADMATTAWAVGQAPSDGSATPVAVSSDPALLTAGYPVLDKVSTYSDVSVLATLQAHADADQQAGGGPLASAVADVPIDDVVAGLVGLGDTVRFERTGRRDGAGFVADLRCTQVDLDPEAQTATLTLSPRVTLGGRVPRPEDDQDRIARLAREVRMLAVQQ